MARGDRFDGKLLRDIDSMHVIMPLIYPNRCDNEAYLFERVNLDPIEAYLARKNAELEAAGGEAAEFKYTIFHVVVAAMLKTIMLRPKMNYFIANGRMYERKFLSGSFVVKKKFADDAGEGLAFVKVKAEDTIETIHEAIRKQVYATRSGHTDESSDSMDLVSSLPFFLTRFVCWASRQLDRHGKCPRSFVASDPYYNTVVFSNLGSIKMKAGYHHLMNWGTNSVFCIIGEKKMRPFFNEDGTYEMHQSLDLGLTIDERIADGYYYSKTMRLLRAIMANPEILEEPLSTEVEY